MLRILWNKSGVAVVSSCLIACLIAGFLPVVSYGQLPKFDDKRLGVDFVKVDQEQWYGFVLSRNASGLRFAIEKNWLKRTYPDRFQVLAKQEREDVLELTRQRIERVKHWQDERLDDRAMQRFLTRQMRDLEFQLQELSEQTEAEPAEPSFFVVELENNQIQRLFVQSPERRKIAGLAFQYGIPKVVTTPARNLQNRLKELQVDIGQEKVDLSGGLPKIQKESKRQWAARQAIVEFVVVGRLEFQGVGDKLFRADEQVPPAQLMQALMPNPGDMLGKLGADLGLPEFKKFARSEAQQDDRWIKQATDAAEKKKVRGVRVTRLHQDIMSTNVKVTCHFFVREELDSGAWFEAWRHTETEDAQVTDPQELAKLRNDPQIQPLLTMFEGVGFGAGGEQRMATALNHGAATKRALDRANAAFEKLLDQNSGSVIGAPVPLREQSN